MNLESNVCSESQPPIVTGITFTLSMEEAILLRAVTKYDVSVPKLVATGLLFPPVSQVAVSVMLTKLCNQLKALGVK